MSNDDRPKVKVIHRKNRLRDKVGAPPGQRPGEIDPKLIAAAQAAVGRLAPDYETQAARELAAIQAAVVEANATSGMARLAAVRRIEALTNEMRGAGETFGYPLLSKFGRSCCSFVQDLREVNDAQMVVIAAHVDAMASVVTHKIQGDGGAIGRELALALRKAIDKFRGAAGGAR
ncbi:MAG: hypothetical protein HYR63_28810 [Proteobacteria bacterium]|nr:hypothetical protein [Pseudomonadota bacterium]MBI3496811.1 hypothetical protein [Pseudomonadota bacterium]